MHLLRRKDATLADGEDATFADAVRVAANGHAGVWSSRRRERPRTRRRREWGRARGGANCRASLGRGRARGRARPRRPRRGRRRIVSRGRTLEKFLASGSIRGAQIDAVIVRLASAMFRGYVGVETLARGAASAPLFPRLREDGEVQIAERLRPRETPPPRNLRRDVRRAAAGVHGRREQVVVGIRRAVQHHLGVKGGPPIGRRPDVVGAIRKLAQMVSRRARAIATRPGGGGGVPPDRLAQVQQRVLLAKTTRVDERAVRAFGVRRRRAVP